MNKNNEVYKNRDIMLGEIHATTKKLDKWLTDHEEDDKNRFFWTWSAILAVALFAGVIPQMAAWALERFK